MQHPHRRWDDPRGSKEWPLEMGEPARDYVPPTEPGVRRAAPTAKTPPPQPPPPRREPKARVRPAISAEDYEGLRGRVLAFLRARPGQEVTPQELRQGVGSSGVEKRASYKLATELVRSHDDIELVTDADDRVRAFRAVG